MVPNKYDGRFSFARVPTINLSIDDYLISSIAKRTLFENDYLSTAKFWIESPEAE